MGVRKFAVAGAVLLASIASVAVAPVAPVSAAPGDGLRAIDSSSSMTGACNGIDASTSSWTWAKPSLEFSTNNGSTYATAAGSAWGFVVCRATTPMKQYWFIVGPSRESIKDMGTAGQAPGLQFRVTIPAKSGDTTTYVSGYSTMVSYAEQSGSALIESRPASLSKINMDTISGFKSRHPECASYDTSTINKCSVNKADEDYAATIIQHVGYTDAALTSMEETMRGLWVGANVNSFQIGMSCPGGMSGASAQSAQDTVTIGGKTYTRLPSGKFRGPDGTEYTQDQLMALSGGPSGGSTGGSTSAPELKVTMEGTPRFRRDGVTLNRGSLKIFIPSAIATKCFGTSTSTLADIAKQLTLTRSEATEGTSTPVFTSEAVTTPVAGIIVSVAEMTFSNPNYTLKSLLRAASAGSTTGGSTTGGTTSGGSTTGGTTTGGSTTGGSTSGGAVTTPVATLKVKGAKATISVRMAKAGTIKIYRKLKGKTTLVKTVKAKAGANSTVVSYAKGSVYTVRSSTGKVIATLK